MTAEWFAVDKEGLAALLARRGAWFAVYELIQNAVDEDGVTTVEVEINGTVAPRGRARLTVEDDAPDGFVDLAHAFTLFAPSKKKGDAEKRGRFNLGEKLVLAVCESAEIRSTRGGFLFDRQGRTPIRQKREVGSLFDAQIRMTKPEVEETVRRVHSIIPPAGVVLTINGEPVEHREPLHTFKVTLPTEIEDEEGRLRPTARLTAVSVYEPHRGEAPAIYEMGIPVVEVEDCWIVDVGQKVPLNMDRDNVTPGYLRRLRTAVLNEMAERVTPEEATGTWVKDALAQAEPEAVQTIVTKLFGERAVIYDPSDPEANKRAAADGRTVIPPRAFDRQTWEAVRSTGAFKPAGQVTPSPKVLSGPGGIPPLPVEEWTAAHHRIADYARRVHRNIVLSGDVSPVECSVDFQHRFTGNGSHQAWYSRGHLTINIACLGKAWLSSVSEEALDALLIHEFGHYYASDHLSTGYYDALCTLGARLRARSEKIGRL